MSILREYATSVLISLTGTALRASFDPPMQRSSVQGSFVLGTSDIYWGVPVAISNKTLITQTIGLNSS